MNKLSGFPPIAAADARTLILGSMPGAASLAAGEYYAHPSNTFWRIICALFNAPRDLPYPAKVKLLTSNGIALWDVIAACRRTGSADAAIAPESMRLNDFSSFFRAHPAINQVCFNGRTAEVLFTRQVLPQLAPGNRPQLLSLPSTSPAHARLNFAEKLERWRLLAE